LKFCRKKVETKKSWLLIKNSPRAWKIGINKNLELKKEVVTKMRMMLLNLNLKLKIDSSYVYVFMYIVFGKLITDV
jgi:alpha-tubulin suppressor-like RCC1 family protein